MELETIELEFEVREMVTKDLVQKMITSMGEQSKSSIYIDSLAQEKILTVLQKLDRELNFRPNSWASSILHGNRKDELIHELIRLLGYRSVMSFCN